MTKLKIIHLKQYHTANGIGYSEELKDRVEKVIKSQYNILSFIYHSKRNTPVFSEGDRFKVKCAEKTHIKKIYFPEGMHKILELEKFTEFENKSIYDYDAADSACFSGLISNIYPAMNRSRIEEQYGPKKNNRNNDELLKYYYLYKTNDFRTIPQEIKFELDYIFSIKEENTVQEILNLYHSNPEIFPNNEAILIFGDMHDFKPWTAKYSFDLEEVETR